VNSVAFSPGGHTLASSSADGTIRLWDITDPARPRPLGQPLAGSTAAVDRVAFSPGGHTLASGSFDGTVRLWDVTNPARPRPLGQPLAGSTAAVVSVAFSPGGRTLASSSFDGTIRLWNLNVQYAIQRICAIAGGLTPRQWNQYVPQLRYQPSCVQ
jgi:WD40 repeat protein